MTDKLSLGGNFDYGDAPHAVASGAAQWYGLAGYGQFVLNDYFTLNGRGEWYGDTKSFTIGTAGGMENLYEATVNVSIKPFPSDRIGQNLVIRPELRFDYSDKLFFNAGTKHSQASLGIDAYFTF